MTIRGNNDTCPLCKAKLSGDIEKRQYPLLEKKRNKLGLFLKLMALGTALICIVSVLINILLTPALRWSFFVFFGAVCFWLSFSYAIKKRHKLPKNIIVQVIFTSVLCVLWDVLTGFRGWSLDYVIPCTSGGAMIALAVLAKLLKQPASDYIFCLLWDIAFGIIPIVFWLTGKLTVILPSAICIGLSLLFIFSIALFQGKEIKLEVQKRFHM